MYSTSTDYKNKILADSTRQLLNVYIDNNKIEDKYIFECKITYTLLDNDEFCFGSTPAKAVNLKIHKNALPNTYTRFYIESGITGEIVPIGYFNVDEISKDDDYTVSLTLIDDMSLFEFNYDGSTLNYPVSLLTVLQDICSKAGVELGSTSFLNSNKQIAVYDSTVTARTYLGYIAEQAGGFAVIGRDGKLYIKTIGEDTVELALRYFSKYSWGERFKVSRIAYEDGVQDFKKGNETNNTIWINSNNMYIVNQEQIDNIYNEYNNFEVYSFSGTSIVDPAWDIGDILIIDNKKIIYQGDVEYKGKFKANITSNIQTKTKEETTATKISETTKIRRIQSLIDQINATITLLLQETGEYNEKFVEIQASLDGITQTVESMEDFTREKTQVENLYLDDIAEGEGYLINFIVYGNTELFNSEEITICASTKQRGYGEAIYLTTENGEDLLTEDGEQLIVGSQSFYISTAKLTLNDILRNLTIDGETYYDTLEITQDGTIQITRRIGVDNTNNYYLLENEKIETIEEKFVLPSLKDGSYYFIEECSGLQYYAKYITQNDYSDAFLNKIELGTYITQNAEAIRVAWNQISQYLQIEGIDGKATLNIYNENNNMLMSLSQDGQTFYDSLRNKIGTVGIVREENKDTLAFAMNVDWENVTESKSMAWGYFDSSGNFLPIFHLVGTYGAENSEYGGELAVEGNLSAESLEVISNTIKSGDTAINLIDSNGNILFSASSSTGFFNILNLISAYKDTTGSICLDFGNNKLVNMYNVAQTDENLNYIAGSANSHIFARFKDGGSVIIFENASDKKLKKNIKNANKRAIDKIMKIKHREFDWKNNNKHQDVGYIAQEMQKIDENFVHYTKFKNNNGEEEENWQINILSVLATATKAIQEQQEDIQKLQKDNEEKNELIAKILSKIEILENGGKDNGNKN